MSIFADGGGRRVIKLMLFCGHHKCKTPKLVIFYDVQVSRIKKKIHHVQDQKPSIKCAYRESWSKLMVVRTHMDYLFPIEDEIVFTSPLYTFHSTF